MLIAPAVDFSEELMWAQMPEPIRQTILRDGVWMRPSEYSPEPTPITRALIEDGRRHLMFGSEIRTGCPVHILQGMQDPDVPWRHALKLVEHLAGDAVVLTLIKDGDHRLSTAQTSCACRRRRGDRDRALSGSVDADHPQVVLPGIGRGGLARIGHQDRRAIRREQREELQAGLDLRRLREDRSNSSDVIDLR